MARKNSLERPKLREEPGYEGWPVLFWLCRVEIRERKKEREKERDKERIRESTLKFTHNTE